MVELAPNRKSGLVVANPVLLAGGVIGCGEEIPQALRRAGLGAVVVGPLTLAPRRGPSPPRLGQAQTGFVLDSGLQNRGVRSSIQRFRKVWERLEMPVIAQLADREPEALARASRQLEATGALAGLELLLHPQASPAETAALVETVVGDGELPLWVKLPHGVAVELAEAAVGAGADALVICQAPAGAMHGAVATGVPAGPSAGQTLVSGPMHGPAIYPMMLRMLLEVAASAPGVPLIACGGIHCWAEAAAALDAGATAVQIDSAVWVEPGLAASIVGGWTETATGESR